MSVLTSSLIATIFILFKINSCITIIETGTLHPNNLLDNGAKITPLNVDINNNPFEWKLIANTTFGFHLQLTLNSSIWGFHPTAITTLKIEVNGDGNTGISDNHNLLVAFQQTASNQYFATLISIDKYYDHEMIPHFTTSTPYSSYLSGNIKYRINNNMYNYRSYYANYQSFGDEYEPFKSKSDRNVEPPLVFILTNYPGVHGNYLLYTYKNTNVNPRSCGFDTALSADTEMKIYFAADGYGQLDTVDIASITVTLTYEIDTETPTNIPTPEPTIDPTEYSSNSTSKPTSNSIPNITPTATANHNDNLLDVTIYSRGYNHDEINHEFYSFITINNGYNVIAPTKRGFNVVILDKLNGSIVGKYKSNTFNYSHSIQYDMELANYLNSVKSNDIIIITVFDTVTIEDGRNPNYTLSVLQSFGCNIASLGYRESFIFIGTANNNTTDPLWTYCESNPDSNSNGAILKSFQIPLLSMEQTTDYPSIPPSATINSSKYPTMDTTESKIIEHDDESLFNFKAATDTQIIIGICILLICCMIPLSIGITICCCIYKRKLQIIIRKRADTQITHSEPKQDNNDNDNNDGSTMLKSPKTFSITPPGLAGDDSLRITPKSSDGRYIATPSGIPCFGPIQFDQNFTVSTNITLNIEGLQKNIIIADETVTNKPLELREKSDPSLNDDADNVEHKYCDDIDVDHDNDKKQNNHIEIIKVDANNNDNKLNLNGIDSELSDGMYKNNDEYIDDKTYTLRTAPHSLKLRAPQNEQTSTPNTITAESENSGDV